MKDDATLEYGPALEAAARVHYAQVLSRAAEVGQDVSAAPAFEELAGMQKHDFMENTLSIIAAAAPYFAAQGWEIGYGNGDGDSRIVGGDYYENPWGDYVQDKG